MGITGNDVSAPGICGGTVGIIGGVDIDGVLAPIGGGNISIDGVGKVIRAGIFSNIKIEEIHHSITVTISRRVAGTGSAISGIHQTIYADHGGRDRQDRGGRPIGGVPVVGREIQGILGVI